MDLARAVRDGTISTSVARTIIPLLQMKLNALRTEMEASRLGATFVAIPFSSADRNKRAPLKHVA